MGVERQRAARAPGQRSFYVDILRLHAGAGGRHRNIARREQRFEIARIEHRILRRRRADAARAAHVLRRCGRNHHGCVCLRKCNDRR